MIDEKKIELMKKLQRLAERGVGGEKEGAQKKLQQLMKKYNIEESDLSDDKLEDHEWKYHNDFELRLLKQTIYKVLGKDDWGGIACFAILRMVERLQTGLKKRTEKEQKTTRLLLC